MQVTLKHRNIQYDVDLAKAQSVAINLDFQGPQPNHFGTDKASSEVLKLGGFVGNTKAGGSCNVDVLHMIPHCNGTHTETISHIVNEEFWVGHVAVQGFLLAQLVTVQPSIVNRLPENDRGDTYRPKLDPEDRVITRAMLEHAIGPVDRWKKQGFSSLLVRTLPNDGSKQERAYSDESSPAFFTIEAMELIVQLHVQHLLVDVPSVDRMHDDGLLTNHHLFWNVPETTHRVQEDSRQNATISEMIYVPNDIRDGTWLLNLQIPAFGCDAAPSRPVLIPCRKLG